MGGGDARIKIDEKGQTSIVRLVLSSVSFKSGVFNMSRLVTKPTQ